MLNKSLISVLFFLVNINAVFAVVSIEHCRSGSVNWVCYEDKLCECKVVGDCTQGNLVLYRSDIKNPLCLPEISSDGFATIRLSNCESPTGTVKVVADCDESQSEEFELTIEEPTTTTTFRQTTITEEPTTIRETTTTTIAKSSNNNSLIGVLLILFALVVIGVIVFLKNQKK